MMQLETMDGPILRTHDIVLPLALLLIFQPVCPVLLKYCL